MAQQNVPTTAFTEYESFIRSAFKAMACTGCNDFQDVHFWLKMVDLIDDEELLKCYKIFESYKKTVEPLLSLCKDDKEAVWASNITKSFNTNFARLAVIRCMK